MNLFTKSRDPFGISEILCHVCQSSSADDGPKILSDMDAGETEDKEEDAGGNDNDRAAAVDGRE